MKTIIWACSCGETFDTRAHESVIKDERARGLCPACRTEIWMKDKEEHIIVDD